MVICRPTLKMNIGDRTYKVPFSLGAVVSGSNADVSDCMVVAWWVPGTSSSAAMRPGRKKAKVTDIFGPWVPYDEHSLEAASTFIVPSMLVPRNDVLLMNVELLSLIHI